MVVASPSQVVHDERVQQMDIPVIDLSSERVHVSRLIVKSCEEFGFFKVANHGVPMDIVARMEAAGLSFFSLPACEKQKAGPADPLGYGSKNIGFQGDSGEVEYLLLHTNPNFIAQRSRTICREDPENFSCVVNEYVEAMREVASEIVEMLGLGLGLVDKNALSSLIKDRESDSLLRLNYYPSNNNINECGRRDKGSGRDQKQPIMVGFGEHSDPQILTLLRSNDVDGLQILFRPVGGLDDRAVWVPVQSDPTAFFVLVGDVLQALTNGRFMSVRHRAIVTTGSSRLSLVYFGAPPLHAQISPLQDMVTVPPRPRLYRSFTWEEFKKAMYSVVLGYNRLDLFRLDSDATT